MAGKHYKDIVHYTLPILTYDEETTEMKADHMQMESHILTEYSSILLYLAYIRYLGCIYESHKGDNEFAKNINEYLRRLCFIDYEKNKLKPRKSYIVNIPDDYTTILSLVYHNKHIYDLYNFEEIFSYLEKYDTADALLPLIKVTKGKEDDNIKFLHAFYNKLMQK